jgi:hypothetical protein
MMPSAFGVCPASIVTVPGTAETAIGAVSVPLAPMRVGG